MTTRQYERLHDEAIDQIDAAIWSSDLFNNAENIAAFREQMASWERGLKEAEQIIQEE